MSLTIYSIPESHPFMVSSFTEKGLDNIDCQWSKHEEKYKHVNLDMENINRQQIYNNITINIIYPYQ